MSTVALIATDIQQLRGFELPKPMHAQLRRADDFIKLSVTCAKNALDQSANTLSLNDTGIFIGTTFGPLDTNLSALGSLIEGGEGQLSPTLFSHSVYNSAAGYVARLLNIQGPALTLTTHTWPLLNALSQAQLSLLTGRIAQAIVIGVDTYCALLKDAYVRSSRAIPYEDWVPGAVALLLQKDSGQSCLSRIGPITLDEKPCDPLFFLTRMGETWNGTGLSQASATHPLSHAYALTQALSQIPTALPRSIWQITAPFGTASIEVER
jgi:hypothetical protein